MNTDKLIDALGQINDDMIQKVVKLRTKVRKPLWIKWAAFVASLTVFLSVAWYGARHLRSIAGDNKDPTGALLGTQSGNYGELTTQTGIYLNDVYYSPDLQLSETATSENVGAFAGYIALNEDETTNIQAFFYLPEDGKTNRIIALIQGEYQVYFTEKKPTF